MKTPVLALVAASAFCAFALAACNSSSAAPTDAPAPTGGTPVAVDFKATIAPVVTRTCTPCHSGEQPAGGKEFPATIDEAWAKEHADLMKEAAHEVEEGKMPPKNAQAKPTDEEKKAFVDWVKANIS